MTVPASTRRAGPFLGNGTATSFPFTFKTTNATEVQVVKLASGIETTLVKDSDYTVTLNVDQDATPGGTITYPITGTPLATGQSLTIAGAVPYTQDADLPTGGAYRAQVVENALDRAVIQIQQLAEESSRSLRLPLSSSAASTELPAPQASKLIGWDAAGTGLQNVDPTTMASIVAFGTADYLSTTGDGTTSAFTLPSNPGALANLDVSVGGVVQRPTVDYTLSGTTLTFTSAPPNGVPVFARYLQALPQGVTDSAASTFTPAGAGAVARPVQDKLREAVSGEDFGAVFDNSTDSQVALVNALAQSRGVVLAPGVVRVSSGSLSPTAKTRVTGAGRENTFIRTTHASNPVFSSSAQFVTYEHMSLDRTGTIAGQGISHAGVSNSVPLEGFVARHVNANGHAQGVKLRDFVVAAVEDCYLQSGTNGLDVDKTGANFCSVLNVRRTWMRGNSAYNAYVSGVIGSLWEQSIFEGAGGVVTNVGLYLSGGGRHQFVGCWWESLKQAAQFIECGQVTLMGGHWDGAQMTASTAFYAIGSTGATTVVFEGSWNVINHSGTFATADQGATIIIRSPELMGLTFSAVNGGRVIFDCPMEGKATWNPANCNALTKTASTTVTVTGARLGDVCVASFENGTTDPQLFVFKADCFANDTVTVSAFNIHTAAVDLGSGTLTVRVQKRGVLS